MCGIVGIATLDPGALPPAAIVQAMAGAIAHRGPDDEGFARDPRAHIGMRRLAIVDPAGGHQPVASDDGTIQLVFNGEIYNFRELRAALAAHGVTFRSDGDAEVVLRVYERYGVAGFERLHGMFAIAIRDRRRERLVLARDRFGKKPLFLWQTPRSLAFASELKALAELPGFPRDIDTAQLPAYLAFGYVPSPNAIFRGVTKLPPAHYAVWEQGRLRVERYWRLSYQPPFRGSARAAEDELADLLERAVADRLVSDVPFGAFLSGGLDSSVVVALMSRKLGQPVKTFSIGFRDPAFDELADARRVARHCATEHHELVVEPDSVALTEQLVWHLDEPFADASAIPTFLVSRLAAQHVKMVLSGDGGDEAFAGYERYRRFLALERLGRAKPAAAAVLSLAGGALGLRYGRRLRGVAERLRLPFPDNYLSGVALARPALIAQLLGERAPLRSPYAGLDHAFALGRDASLLDRITDADIGSYLLDDILVKLDRMTMAASIEGRAPLLDHRVVEFAVRLPPSLRIAHGRGKVLLRRVAARWLPREVLEKPKQGFGVPLAAWFRGALGDNCADLLASRAFRERGWLDPRGATRLLEQHRAQVADHSEPLWQILCLELWARRFVDAAPRQLRTRAERIARAS